MKRYISFAGALLLGTVVATDNVPAFSKKVLATPNVKTS
jgi:hypothetical protein